MKKIIISTTIGVVLLVVMFFRLEISLASEDIKSEVLEIIQATESNNVTIDFDSANVPLNLRPAITEAVLDKPTNVINGNKFAVVSYKLIDQWALATLAVIDNQPEDVGMGDKGALIILQQNTIGIWDAAIEGTPEYENKINVVPDEVINRGPEEAFNKLPSYASMKFPWDSSQQWALTTGWHETNHVDFAPNLNVSNKWVLAAHSGIVTRICIGTVSANLRVEHIDGTITEYSHLDKNTIQEGLLGKAVPQGAIIGWLYNQEFNWDGCGYSTGPHIHFGLPSQSLIIDGWTVNSSNVWNKDGFTKTVWDYFESTNNRAIRQWKNISNLFPFTWKYQIGSDNERISKILIDDSPFVEVPGCMWGIKSLTPGNHSLEYWVQPNGVNTPTPEIDPWPYIKVACAYDDGTVPPGGNYTDNATFLSDITIPYGTVVSPGQPLNKIWRVRNTGTTTWDTGYQFAFRSGEQMNGPSAISLPASVAPGQEVNLSINLTAPSSLGNHEGYWQMRNPQGTYFGDQLWIKITVDPNGPPAPPPNPEDWDVSVQSVEYPSIVSPGQTFRPRVTVKVNQGQLLQSRGDMLRNTDGNLFGAWPHVAVVGAVNAGQTYMFEFYQDNPITAPASEGTYYSKWRVWRNGVWAGPEITIRFDVSNSGGTRPNPPTPSSPSNWSQFLEGNTPSLCVDSMAGVQYYFQVFESHDTPESGWISNNCWTPSGLGPYNYQWRAKVRNISNNLESDWSEAWHFTLNSTQITIADLEFNPGSPSNSENIRVYTCVQGFGGIGLGLKIEANTATDGSASGEWYWIHHLGTFCYNHSDQNTWPTWETLPLADGDHLVRAVGYGPQGQTVEKTAVYHLERRRPNRPELINPSNDIWLNTTNITFSWEPAHRVTSYRLVVGTNSDPTISPIIDQTLDAGTTSYTASFPTAPQDLYWRVYAINELGSSDSQWHFGIDLNKPASSVSTLPAITYETAFQISWGGSDDLSGLRWYDVQVRDGDRPDSVWVDWLTNITHIADIFIGQAGHTYYFRARALDVAGNLEDWPESDYDTVTFVDPSSRPPAPWWNSAYEFKRSLVLLNNASQALPMGYPMHLHFDSGTTPTANELYSASQSLVKGEDFRIVYNNNQTDLARFIQSFTADAIDIWFNLQADIGPAPASDSTNYQLYYGNPSASSPPSDPNTVFNPVVDGNTIALWRFFEGSGSTVYDASGHGYTGAAQNMGWTQGKFGLAGVFNGQNTVVNMGTSDAFNLPQFTFEAWVKFSQINGGASIFRKEASDTSLIYDAMTDSNRVVLRINGSSCYIIGNTQLVAGRWYHMAWTYDGSTASVYLNGRFDGSQYCGQALRTGPYPLWVGADGRSMNDWLNANLQLARISNIARNSFSYGGQADILTEPSLVAGEAIEQTTPGTPDLVMLNIAAYPNPGGGLIVQAFVQNQGDKSTTNGFYTDLYLDHVPTGAGDYSGSLQFWVNDPIAPGQAVTLTTILDMPMLFGVNSQAALAPAAEITGTLYAQVDSAGSVTEPDDVNNIFTLGMQVCFASPDAFETDDISSQAPIINAGNSQMHNFDSPTDKDWVRFDAQEGENYILQTSNLAASADTYMYLYDTDATTLLASNDDSNGTLVSKIEWIATKTGTFYVLIQHWNPAAGGCQNSYTLTVSKYVPGGSIYLPVILSKNIPPIVTTVYDQITDGEVLYLNCSVWSTCRNAATGNANWQNLGVGTVGAGYAAPNYTIQRVFLFFDTSSIPSSANITSIVLNVFAGQYQNGTKTFHVVPSTAAIPLSTADFNKISFVSGGAVTPTSLNSWVSINFNPTALTWIIKGGLTKVALLNEYDVYNVVPTITNDITVGLAEDTSHKPYLIITYSMP